MAANEVCTGSTSASALDGETKPLAIKIAIRNVEDFFIVTPTVWMSKYLDNVRGIKVESDNFDEYKANVAWAGIEPAT